MNIQVHIPYPLLVERLDEILRREISPEIYMDAASLKIASGEELEEIGKAFTWAGLSVTVHGPYIDLNPGAPDEKTRLHTVEVYQAAFDAAARLAPKTIVLHAGYRASLFKGGPELWLSQSRKTWPRFVRLAEPLDMTIAVENIYEKNPQTQLALIKDIASPNFGACLDTGHLNVFSSVATEEWLRALGAHLAEVHLHDNNGKNDEHLPIGEGTFDFKTFMRLLGEHADSPVLTIEPHGEEMLDKAMKAVRRIIPAC
ncbi:MAG: sugar phosphate isomerase/epimerase [Deltaproteobacteria bacterium]|nr:sugar phosphate isomerase/epimerase [Deltaproteobacteria bacterium]